MWDDHMPQKSQNKQMNWIEPVKEVLYLPPSLPIIEPDGNKSEGSIHFPGNRNGAEDSLQPTVKPQGIQDNNQKYTFVIVVCVQKTGQPQTGSGNEDLHQKIQIVSGFCSGRLKFKIRHTHHNQKPNEESKINILMGTANELIGKSVIKRQFRDQRKYKHTKRIFSGISCMKKTLHKQKTENRKSKSANIAHMGVDHDAEITHGITIWKLMTKGTDKRSPHMVNQHSNNSNQF